MNKKIYKKLRKIRDEIEEILTDRMHCFSDYNMLRDLADDEMRKAIKHIANDDI